MIDLALRWHQAELPRAGSPKPGFTVNQGQYLAFIDAYTRQPEAACRSRHPAPFRSHPTSVHQMVLALERAALIRRQPGAPRSIEVLVPLQNLPVLKMPAEPVKTSVPRY